MGIASSGFSATQDLLGSDKQLQRRTLARDMSVEGDGLLATSWWAPAHLQMHLRRDIHLGNDPLGQGKENMRTLFCSAVVPGHFPALWWDGLTPWQIPLPELSFLVQKPGPLVPACAPNTDNLPVPSASSSDCGHWVLHTLGWHRGWGGQGWAPGTISEKP